MLRWPAILLLTVLFASIASPANADPTHTTITAAPTKDDKNHTGVGVGADELQITPGSTAGLTTTATTRPPAKPIATTTTLASVGVRLCANNNTPAAGDYVIQASATADYCAHPEIKTPPDEVAKNAVQHFYQTTALPIPKPTISATNGGICGVRHSLDLHMNTRQTYTYPGTDFGDVFIGVTGVSQVNWGDGTRPDTYSTSGGPWPNKEISHFWINPGNYNITVTTTWVAEWTVRTTDGQTYGGVLSNLTTTGSIPNFNVIQAQAVLIQ